jgi:hypothetical protein
VICRLIESMHPTRARQGDVVPVEAMNLALDGKRALVTGSSAVSARRAPNPGRRGCVGRRSRRSLESVEPVVAAASASWRGRHHRRR